MNPRCKPRECENCVLYSHGTDFSQPEGLGLLKVMVVAEASGEGEARDGLPLRPWAPSGAIFERTLRRLGLSRDQFVVTNCLACRPRDNKLEGMPYEQAALAACSPNLAAALRQFRPKVLLALGNVALRHLTGMAGKQRGVGHLRGYVLRALTEWEQAAGRDHETDPLLVIPTYHPAFLRRGAIHLTGVLARDIARAVNVAAGRDRGFVLDLPDLSLRADGRPYDPVSNPDPWDDNYSDWEQRRKQEIQSDLAAWLAANNLRYQLYPTRRDLDLFCRDVKARSDAWLAMSPDARAASYLYLSHDLETAESASLDEDATDGFTDTVIRLSQFSVEPGQGIALQWDKDGIAATRWLLKLSLPKVGYNHWYFDSRVLRAVGARDFGDPAYLFPAGVVHDALQQFHFFQSDLPAHLQFAASFSGFPFPWKHLSDTCLELYGCVDPDAAGRVYLTTRKTMEDRGVWWDSVPGRQAAGYVAQVEMVRPILAKMEDQGLPINDVRRVGLGVEFEAAEKELKGELNSRFPDEARKIKSYKTVPQQVKEILEGIRPTELPAADALGENGKPLTKTVRAKLEKAARTARWAGVTKEELAVIRARRFQDSPTENDDGEKEEGEKEGEKEGEEYFFDLRWLGPEGKPAEPDDPEALRVWCRVYEFSPNSSPQLMAYMKAHRHEIPFNRKEGRNTTGKTELVRLGAKHKDDFYAKVIECREVRKMKGTYIDGYRPHADGRAHPTFTFSTATQQLAARNPNSQNYPARSRLAKAVKSMIEAPEGMELANWDLKSYHVLITGFLAEDAGYMRMARLDMHSFVSWHFLRLPGAGSLHLLPDEELKEKFEWFKSDSERKQVRDNQAKPSILGIALGLMPPHLYEMNREHFESLAHAKRFREVIEGLFPKVFDWQKRVCREAHQQQVLYNRFGASRWFYEVYAPDGKGGLKPGDQFNAAMAFRVQSEAHGELREKFKRLRAEEMDEKFGLVNTIHDSITLCYRKELREDMLAGIGRVLAEPSKVLVHPVLAPRGLTVGVECAIGKNMAELKGVEVEERGQGQER